MKRAAAAVIVVFGVAITACGPSPRAQPGGDDTTDAGTGGSSDAGNGSGSGSGSGSGDTQTSVYAHTASTLYRVDPDSLAITEVGDFGWPASVFTDQMTDIAIDKNGVMIGISYTNVYRVDDTTAKTTLLTTGLQGMFNGLSFVPAAMLGRTGDDVLVATRNTDGVVFEVDQTNGQTTQVGNMGAYASSGDLVAVAGFGTVLTAANGDNPDLLVTLAPSTFAASPVGATTIGYSEIWGVAFWKGKIFGFTDGGDFILIDATTGVGTLVAHNSEAWWGAAVTTVAPIIE